VARSKGLELVVLRANTDRDIEAAFSALVQKHAEALLQAFLDVATSTPIVPGRWSLAGRVMAEPS
jgi:hypothetical protein